MKRLKQERKFLVNSIRAGTFFFAVYHLTSSARSGHTVNITQTYCWINNSRSEPGLGLRIGLAFIRLLLHLWSPLLPQ